MTLCHCSGGEELSLADLLDDPVIQAVIDSDGAARGEVEGLIYEAPGKATPAQGPRG